MLVPAAPGAGKTTLAEVIVLMVLLHNRAAKFFVVEPTKEMCAAAEARLLRGAGKVGLPHAVSRVGYNDDTGEDYMTGFITARLDAECTESLALLRAVDRSITFLEAGRGTPCERVASGLIRYLLARRHDLLDRCYYRERQWKRARIIEDIRVFVVTPAKLAELRGVGNEWSCLLEDSSVTWCLIADEMQRYSWKTVAAMAIGCSVCILTGDVDQGPDPGQKEKENDPFRAAFSAAPRWLVRAREIQRSPLVETMRLGATHVEMLQTMFPGRHRDMVSHRGGRGESGDSQVLLTRLPRLSDWVHCAATSEIVWSPTFTKHCGALVAVELVQLLHDREEGKHTGGVMIVSFLKSFLRELECFLEANLPALCAAAHELLDEPQPADGLARYDFRAAREAGALSVAASLAAGGGDCPVEILCLPHRQREDWGWMGHASQRHLQFIAASRASRRLHVLAEDLRREIVLPIGDTDLVREGTALGLMSPEEHGTAGRVDQEQVRSWQRKARAQMPLVRLLHFAEGEWTRLGVPAELSCTTAGVPGAPLAFSAKAYWDHVGVPAIRQPGKIGIAVLMTTTEGMCSAWGVRRGQRPRPNDAPGPGAAPSGQVTRDTALEDWRYLQTAINDNPDCEPTGVATLETHADGISKYAVDAAGDKPGDGLQPAVLAFETRWRDVAVDAVCVHLSGDTEVTITFPVAPKLLWDASQPEGGHEADDPNWVVRRVSSRAWARFMQAALGRRLQSEGGSIRHEVSRHKKLLGDLGEATFGPRDAAADRPAFCITVANTDRNHGGPGATELSHAYTARGLPLQHRSQTALLARTDSFEVAACFLGAIGDVLHCGARAGAISASNDPLGWAQREAFGTAMLVAGVAEAAEHDGRPLDVQFNEEFAGHVAAAAEAGAAGDCWPFLLALLGPSHAGVTHESAHQQWLREAMQHLS